MREFVPFYKSSQLFQSQLYQLALGEVSGRDDISLIQVDGVELDLSVAGNSGKSEFLMRQRKYTRTFNWESMLRVFCSGKLCLSQPAQAVSRR